MKKRALKIRSFSPSEVLFYGMIAAIGIILLLIAVAAGRKLCLIKAQGNFNATVQYLKQQCEEYGRFLDSDEEKSLFRIAEQADSIGRTLAFLPQSAKSEWLREYRSTQQLDCVVLTDEELSVTATYVYNKSEDTDFQSYIPYEAIRTISEHPVNTYSDRFSINNALCDFAAAARHDAKGLVLCFRLQDKESLRNDYRIVQGLLAGDSNELNGTTIIADGDTILSSNRKEMPNGIHSVSIAASLDNTAENGSIAEISDGKNTFYGGKTVYNGYGIYVYYPSADVFADCFNIIALAFCIYCIIIFFVIAFHQRAKHLHMLEINEQYEIISTISRMFVYNVFVNMKENRFRFLLRAADFAKADETLPANVVLQNDFTNYAAEPYRASYRSFCDMNTLKKRLEGKEYIELEYQNIHGEWLNDIIIPKRNEGDGDFDSFLLLTKNVSEQKTLEIEYQNRLEKAMQNERTANEAKTDLMRRMSHDVRTPINAILGMIEIADRNASSVEKQNYCRNQVRIAAEYLLELVNDILTLNRTEFENNCDAKTTFDVKDEAEKIFAIVNVRAQNAGVTLEFPTVRSSGTPLVGNVLYLNQIMINILTNAVKYSHKGGSVSFSLTEAADAESENGALVRFVCTDSGIGMSRDFQQKMFEPFAQESNEETDTDSGLGLGLAIVKKLVEKSGGTLSVQSQKHLGTQFEITLPFQYASPKNALPDENTTYSIDGFRVLIAEDNLINMEIAEYLLQDGGAAVVKAFNGKEAAEAFAASKPNEFDIILMDISMPVWDGLKAAKKIRELHRDDAKTVPIIAMTANLFIQDIEKCLKAGMNGYLPKPINANQLIKVIAEEVFKRRDTRDGA